MSLKLIAIGAKAMAYVARNEAGEEWRHIPKWEGRIEEADNSVHFIMVPEIHKESDLMGILREAARVLIPRGVLNLQGAQIPVSDSGEVPTGLMVAWAEESPTDKGPWAFVDLVKQGDLYPWEKKLLQETGHAESL